MEICNKCNREFDLDDMIILDGEILCEDCFKIKRYIYDLLIKLGFNVSSNGFNLWYEAIMLYDKNVKMMYIYEKLAQKNNMSYTAVERQLRYSIKKIISNIQKYYNYYQNIDNKTFLNLLMKEGEIDKWKSLKNGLNQLVLGQ